MMPVYRGGAAETNQNARSTANNHGPTSRAVTGPDLMDDRG